MKKTKVKKANIKILSRCALFTALIAIGAFIQIPVPMMDYFTLQLLFVLLAGMIMGAVAGALSAGVYVLLGLIGLPVFASGGGISYILRPSFGYLLGFIVAAYVTGYISQKLKASTFKHYIISAFSGMVVTYIIGFSYKFMIMNFYMNEATSILPIITASLIGVDIPGDILLCFVSAVTAKRLNPIIGR